MRCKIRGGRLRTQLRNRWQFNRSTGDSSFHTRSIKKMAKKENLVLEEFTTLICRIQGIMNSRPLFPCSAQPGEDPALTPQHFLTLRAMLPTAADFTEFSKSPVTKRWLEVEKVIAHYWEIYQQDYISTLQKRINCKFPTRNMQVDDVVLLTEMNATPGVWRLGRVTRVFPSLYQHCSNCRKIVAEEAGELERELKRKKICRRFSSHDFPPRLLRSPAGSKAKEICRSYRKRSYAWIEEIRTTIVAGRCCNFSTCRKREIGKKSGGA